METPMKAMARSEPGAIPHRRVTRIRLFALAVVATLAVMSGVSVWRMRSLNDLPDVGDPFDVAEARKLAAMATARYAVNKRVIVLRPEQVIAAELPPVLAETLPNLPELHCGRAFAVVCKGTSCLPPASDPEVLLETLNASL